MKSRINYKRVNPILERIEALNDGYRGVCEHILEYIIRHNGNSVKISRIVKELTDDTFDEETLRQGMVYLNSAGLLSNHIGKSGHKQIGEEIYRLSSKFITKEKGSRD